MLDANQLFWTEIAAAVCLLIFCALLVNLLRLRAKIKGAASWNKVAGEIVVSKVDQPESHVSDDLNDATPIVRYRYISGGQPFEGDQIKIGGQAMTTRVLAGKLVGRYPVGARVDVYVDPNNPKTAALEPRKQDNLVAQLVLTIVFGAIGAILAAHAIAGKVLYSGNGVPLFAFALPIGALLAALVSLLAFTRGRRLAKVSLTWPTVPGTITSSSIIDEEIEDESNTDKAIIRKIHRYQVDLRFAYQIAQRDYVGTSAGWGWTAVYGRLELAEKAAGKYAKGQPVTVYYDPDQPGNSVLEPSNRQGSMAPLVVGVIFATGGALMLAFFVSVGFA